MAYLSTFQVKPVLGFDVFVAPWRSDELRAQRKYQNSVRNQCKNCCCADIVLLLTFTSISKETGAQLLFLCCCYCR